MSEIEKLLKVEKLNVYYGNVNVVRDVSFEISKNEKIVTIVGSNGAGKSTLLNAIFGLKRAQTGSIWFQKNRIDNLQPHQIIKLGISYVPEGRNIFSYMTVIENLLVGVQSKRSPSSLRDSLEFVYNSFPILKERKKQLAKTLSGGEQQMLTMGRGLMITPKLLILDEPSLGVSPLLTEQIFEVIKKLSQEEINILLCSQETAYSLELADLAFVMENGKIVLSGPGNKLAKNKFVKKSYLGL